MKEIANILLTGILVSFLMFLMVEVLFAHFINSLLLDVLEDGLLLMLIILGLELIIMVLSILVGVMVAQNVSRLSVLKASLMSFICNMLFIVMLSYFSLFLMYPEVFSEVSGLEIIFILPQVIVYYSLYILNNVLSLLILSVISYYIIFIVFLNQFHEYSSYNNRSYKKYEGW